MRGSMKPSGRTLTGAAHPLLRLSGATALPAGEASLLRRLLRGPRRAGGLQTRHNHQPGDFAVIIGLHEAIVVLDRDAAVRITLGAQHVAMGQQAGPAKRGSLDRGHPQRTDTVE